MQEHNEEPDAIKAASLTEVVAVLVGDVIEKLFSRIAKQPTGIVQPQPVPYGQSYNPYALPGNGAQLAAGLLAYPQMGHQPAMSAYTGQLQAGIDQAGFNPMLAQMHSMAAFNLGGNLGSNLRTDRFRAQQNFVPGRNLSVLRLLPRLPPRLNAAILCICANIGLNPAWSIPACSCPV